MSDILFSEGDRAVVKKGFGIDRYLTEGKSYAVSGVHTLEGSGIFYLRITMDNGTKDFFNAKSFDLKPKPRGPLTLKDLGGE